METDLEQEVKKLKIRLELLESYLATTNILPVLGPGRLEAYQKDLMEKLSREKQ